MKKIKYFIAFAEYLYIILIIILLMVFMSELKQELEQRWLLYQCTNEWVFDLLDTGKGVFYCWFDPTAPSLHLWNFIGFMVAVHLMRKWNTYIALTWGATGMIWDPSGKESERSFLTPEELEQNAKNLSNQMSNILNNLKKFTWQKFEFDFVNNKDFYEWFSYIDFLRDVGKYITVNVMISKDNVKRRIDDPTQSISYTEFSYMLLQWYDFCKLHVDKWVNLQIWWQDQWGNLVTWTELIRKKYDTEVYALTWPLITDSTGKKFGKSEWNALFLDRDQTSPYEIYQYFMNTSDEDVERYLKMLTLLDLSDIFDIVWKHNENPQERYGQKHLAYHVVEIIHSSWDADVAQKISELLFGTGDKLEILKGLSVDEIGSFYDELGGFEYSGENLFETIVKSWLAKSNSEARQAVQSGAIYIQEQQISDFQYNVSDVFLNDSILLIRKGKKNFRIVKK